VYSRTEFELTIFNRTLKTKPPKPDVPMDRYDSLILEIIQEHKAQSAQKEKIKLRNLERTFWKQIESDKDLSVGQGRIGERITKLYVNGLIENKDGYMLTRKGKVQLEVHAGSI
jgi:hypothetical protein